MSADLLGRLQAIEVLERENRVKLDLVLKLLSKRSTPDRLELSAGAAAKFAGVRKADLIRALERGQISGARKVPRGAAHTWKVPGDALRAWKAQQ